MSEYLAQAYASHENVSAVFIDPLNTQGNKGQMEKLRVLSLLCCPVQRQTIERWQQTTGTNIEHHNSLPEFLHIIADYGNIIVFVGWSINNPTQSAQVLSQVKEHVSLDSYLITISPTDNEQDIVTAFESGSDRFIRTDISTCILAEVINAIARRINMFLTVHIFPPYSMNQETREVSVAHEKIQLTPKQFRIAQYLFEKNGQVLTRCTLLRDLWNISDIEQMRRVDTQLSHLRTKIKLDGTYGWSLKYPRRKGYQLSIDNDEHDVDILPGV